MKRKHLIQVGVLFIIISVTVAAVRTGDIYFQIKKQLSIFSDVYTELVTLYVDEVPPARLMETGIDAMLESLDPYTTFIDEGEQQQMEILSTGTYGGIGLEAGFRGDMIVVIAPIDGYPAARAGIRPGDIIRSVNGVVAEDMTPEEVQQLTVGDIGTTVQLEVERRGIDQWILFELERERIEVKSISFAGLVDGQKDIGYIRLNRFGHNASRELRIQIDELKENGELQGLILDLRNNPGGLLQEAVEIVDLFIDPGELVVETKGRLEEQESRYHSDKPALYDDLRLVVLQNHGSASASEIVSGALQDLDRAVVTGENSFGKGLVQTIRPLSYNTSLKLTVSKYYIPSGRSIQSVDYRYENGEELVVPDSLRREFSTRNGRVVFDGAGIEPDILVEIPQQSLLETALRQQNHFFFFINDVLSEHRGNSEPSMPGNLYEQFLDYLEEQQFSYETSADRYIERLQESVDQFSDSEEAAGLLTQLETYVQAQKQKTLAQSRDQIEKALELEWISTVEGENRKVQASLSQDKTFTSALDILLDTERYYQILSH